MFRDTGTECDLKQEGQGITFVLVVTAVINQGETSDKAGQFHYYHVQFDGTKLNEIPDLEKRLCVSPDWRRLESGQISLLCQKLERHLYTDAKSVSEWVKDTFGIATSRNGGSFEPKSALLTRRLQRLLL